MGKKLDGLKIANQISNDKGGKCLSLEYIGINTKMLWGCACNHRWQSTLHRIKNHNSWCHECAGNTKLSLSIAKDIAKERRGRCLSKFYINNIAKMKWRCKENHTWFASLNNVKRGSWCRECVNNDNASNYKLNNGIGVAIEVALIRDGKCLSTEYINNSTKMKWQCECKYIWYATLANIKNNNRWCPKCAVLKRARSGNKSYILYHWKTEEELVCTASYEKAVVEYLNENKINFRWQPRSFKMPNGRRYHPDMYLLSSKKWIEIKGFMRETGRKKWEWFQTIKPNSELWDKAVLESMGII